MAVREWRSLEEADVSNSTRTVPSVCVCVCYFGTMGYGTLKSSDSIVPLHLWMISVPFYLRILSVPGGKKNRGTCVFASRMVLWLVLESCVWYVGSCFGAACDTSSRFFVSASSASSRHSLHLLPWRLCGQTLRGFFFVVGKKKTKRRQKKE